MNTHTKEQFQHRTVMMDHNSFMDCEFDDCRFIFTGLGDTGMTGCKFNGKIQVSFVGAAANTVAVLRAMASPDSGFSEAIKSAFPDMLGR